MHFLAYPLETIPYVIVSLLIAFTVHEWSHAVVALWFGDDTAKREGRLSLNPVEHVDLFGMLMIIIAGFGWAKPTPVNRFKLRSQKWGSVLVSLAGPVSNLLLAAVGAMIYALMINNGSITTNIFIEFLNVFIQLNIVLFVFNLIPFPPLDGYQILIEFLPLSVRSKLQPVEQYAALILLIIAVTPISNYTISPIFNYLIPTIFEGLMRFFLALFGG